MKLASYRQGRDGQLMLVSRDLRRCVSAIDIAPTLQAALDHWSDCESALSERYEQLQTGAVKGEQNFDVKACASPLPRAYQWADGSAYVNHVALVRRARGAKMPESFWHDPLMYQGGSDAFLDPTGDILVPQTEGFGVDFEAEVAVITGDVAMGCSAADAGAHIRLLMLVNDVSLRGLIPGELAKGFGFFQSKPASAFSPVCVTPDELDPAWREEKLHLSLRSQLNGEMFGEPNAGVDMTFSFAQLIAHAARTRDLTAGTIIGSGTVSNTDADGGPGKTIADGGLGYSCIAEQRMVEILRDGEAKSRFLEFGDRVQIDMLDAERNSIFGQIDQVVRAL